MFKNYIVDNSGAVERRKGYMFPMMKKYRKKPVVIRAFQWVPSMVLPDEFRSGALFAVADQGKNLCINTLEGTMTAQPFDWIICGVKGEYYPCKPDIFWECYEEVE